MKHYIIDGNNLIGKIKSLKRVQQRDRQGSREKLSYLIDNYFHNRKAKVTLHFDGYEQEILRPNYSKIIYSENEIADDKIKKQIENSSNRKNLIVVTSDGNLTEFARVCSCTVIRSEDFAEALQSRKFDEENEKIKRLENQEGEFRNLFGVEGN